MSRHAVWCSAPGVVAPCDPYNRPDTRVRPTLVEPRRAQTGDVQRRGLPVADDLRQQLPQRRRVHHPVPRPAVDADRGSGRPAPRPGWRACRATSRTARPSTRPGRSSRAQDRHPRMRHRDHGLDPGRVDAGVERSARHTGRGPQQQHPAVAHTQMEAVAGPDGHRHVGGQQIARRGGGDLSPERRHRQSDARHRRDGRGPRTGGVHHRVDRHRSPGRSPPRRSARRCRAGSRSPRRSHSTRTPSRRGGGEISLQHPERPDEPVARAEGAAHDPRRAGWRD